MNRTHTTRLGLAFIFTGGVLAATLLGGAPTAGADPDSYLGYLRTEVSVPYDTETETSYVELGYTVCDYLTSATNASIEPLTAVTTVGQILTGAGITENTSAAIVDGAVNELCPEHAGMVNSAVDSYFNGKDKRHKAV